MLPTELRAHHEQQFARLPAEIAALADERVRVRRGVPKPDGKCVLYWMQRAQRSHDNPALDLTVQIANALALPVIVFFSVVDNYPHANLRHYYFMQQGLRETELELAEREIAFVVRRPPENSVEQFAAEVKAAVIIGDENPLRFMRAKREKLARAIALPYLTVDADVVVPSALLEKSQYAAHTARPRLEILRDLWLKPCANTYPMKKWHARRFLRSYPLDEDITAGWKNLDRSIKPVEQWHGGEQTARKRLRWFLANAFHGYAKNRNEPSVDGTTKLSPYLHFGQISPLTLALEAQKAFQAGKAGAEDLDSLFNELLIWRELAVNFVTHNEHYDSWACAEPWALQTIREHAEDRRDKLYSLDQLRAAQTHDDLWNAAQQQMLQEGWMHNRLRMYWAKKILEWSPNIATAYEHAVILNDTYFLDGRDANGYAGIAWSIVGKFDRPWFERPVFGKIRYMSRESTGKKFNSGAYIARYGEPAQSMLRL